MYEKIIYENFEKGYQYRLTYSLFKDQEYVNLRKYFLSYEGEYVPSTEGATIPASIENVVNLLDGLFAMLSSKEAKEMISSYLESKISD